MDKCGQADPFCDAQVVKNKKKEMFCAFLDRTVGQCAKVGHVTQTISCDEEFKSLMDPVHDKMNIDMDCSTPGDHESAAE